MRLLEVLALAAPVAVGILFLTVPNAMHSWSDAGTRSVLTALVAGALGVSLTVGMVATYFRHRFGRLIKAAEQIASGDYTTNVRPGAGLEGRLGTAVNEIARTLAETYDRATIDRLTGVANRQAVLAERSRRSSERRATSDPSRSPSSTSITSRPSTTPKAMRRVTPSCVEWLGRWPRTFAQAT